MAKKKRWGGRREGAGAPQKHNDDWQRRTIVVVCSNEEWARLKGLLPSDMREKYEMLVSMLGGGK